MSEETDNPERPEREFRWDKKKERAALLLAEAELSDEAIAKEVGTGRTSLWEWRKKEPFRARIAEHQVEIRASIRGRGIGITENRVSAQQHRWDLLKRIIRERGVSPDMQGVPGGTTGLLVHNVKSVGAGPSAERVDLYELDAALLKEMRELEKHAAQELGQWTEKKDVTTGGEKLKGYVGVSPDDWDNHGNTENAEPGSGSSGV